MKVLRRYGWTARTSREDNGTQGGRDIISNAPFAIEVKDHARVDLPGWWRQAVAQAGGDLPVVWHKRRGKGDAEDWWVTMDGRTFMEVLDRIREW